MPCHATSQWRNKWLLVSKLLEHIKHIYKDNALWGLHTCNISLVLTLSKTAIQTKALALDGALNFQKELRNGKSIFEGCWTKKLKKDLQVNILEESSDQICLLGLSEKSSINLIRSRIRKSLPLRFLEKWKFHDKFVPCCAAKKKKKRKGINSIIK